MAHITNETVGAATRDGHDGHDHAKGMGCTAPTYLGAKIGTVLLVMIAAAIWWFKR